MPTEKPRQLDKLTTATSQRLGSSKTVLKLVSFCGRWAYLCSQYQQPLLARIIERFKERKKRFLFTRRAYVAIVRAAFNTNNSSFVKALEPERLAVIEWAVNILFI